MSAIANFFGNLVAREKAAADFARQAYDMYQAGAASHDPQQLTSALGGMQDDWQTMLHGRPAQPAPAAPPIQRGAIAAAVPGGK